LTLRLSRKLLWFIPLIFVGFSFYYPVLSVLGLGFGNHFNASNPSEISVWPVLWFTIWQAVLSTVICLVLGIPGAYVLYRKSFPGVNLLRSLITVPFMLPSLVVAIAITEFSNLVGGVTPITAIIIANVFANYSVVVRTVGSQWQNLNQQSDEEAEIAGAGRFMAAIKVSLPQLKGSIRSSSALIVLYCASSYGIVLSLGGGKVNTLETAISISVLQRLDLQHGAALAILQILFTVAAFTASRWGGTNPLSFEPHHGKAASLDKRDWPVSVFTFITVLVLMLVPMILVFVRAFISTNGLTLNNFFLLDSHGYRNLLNITFAQAAFNSFRNLVFATVIAVLLGGLVSYLLAERTRRITKLDRKTDAGGIFLDAIFLMPIGVSAVVLGLGFLVSLSWLRSSWFVLPLVQSVIAIPMVIRVLYPALLSIENSPREQALTDGAKAHQLFFHIDLKLVSPALKTAVAFSALVSLGEFGAASLLSYGDQSTVPMLLFQLISRPGAENYGMALAVAALLAGITTLIVMLVSFETKSVKAHRQ
jgi:thiamine transport system permease protein